MHGTLCVFGLGFAFAFASPFPVPFPLESGFAGALGPSSLPLEEPFGLVAGFGFGFAFGFALAAAALAVASSSSPACATVPFGFVLVFACVCNAVLIDSSFWSSFISNNVVFSLLKSQSQHLT
jgi:hypothetical protein